MFNYFSNLFEPRTFSLWPAFFTVAFWTTASSLEILQQNHRSLNRGGSRTMGKTGWLRPSWGREFWKGLPCCLDVGTRERERCVKDSETSLLLLWFFIPKIVSIRSSPLNSWSHTRSHSYSMAQHKLLAWEKNQFPPCPTPHENIQFKMGCNVINREKRQSMKWENILQKMYLTRN